MTQNYSVHAWGGSLTYCAVYFDLDPYEMRKLFLHNSDYAELAVF